MSKSKKYNYQKYNFSKLFAEKTINTNNYISNSQFAIKKESLNKTQVNFVSKLENKEDQFSGIVKMLDVFPKENKPFQEFIPEYYSIINKNNITYKVVYAIIEDQYIGMQESYYNLCIDLNLKISLINLKYGSPLILTDNNNEEYFGIVLPFNLNEESIKNSVNNISYTEYINLEITKQEQEQEQKEQNKIDKNIVKLQKFTSKDNNRESFTQVHETENYYTACDGYRIVALFKDNNNKKIVDTTSADYNNTALQSLKNTNNNKHNFASITINTKQIIEILKEIKDKLKQNTKEKNYMVKIETIDNKLVLSSKIYDYSNIIDYLPATKFEIIKTIDIDTNNRLTQIYAYDLNYLLDILQLITDETFIFYFDTKVTPLLIESSNTLNLLLPINYKTDAEIQADNIHAEQKEIERQQKEVERKIKEEKEQKEIETMAQEKFINNEYITADEVLILCKKHNITIPLKTHGYINKKLVSCTIDGKIKTCGKNTSNSIWDVLDQLKQSITISAK